MPNEIDVKGLRRAHEILTVYFQHDPKGGCDSEGCTSDCPTVAAREEIDSALPALLDEIERLRGEQKPNDFMGASRERAALIAERDALKEKMEKVRDKALEWQAGPNVDYDWCGGRILAILDGKEG